MTSTTTEKTARETYLDALTLRAALDSAAQRGARFANSTASRILVGPNQTERELKALDELARVEDYETAKAARSQAALNDFKACGERGVDLLAAVEAGEIDLAMLLDTVPDDFGRTSPFATATTYAETGRSYVSRNLDLYAAVKAARRENAKGNRSTVIRDLCG